MGKDADPEFDRISKVKEYKKLNIDSFDFTAKLFETILKQPINEGKRKKKVGRKILHLENKVS